ncbi:MAG: hypothetical protein ACI4A3_09155 [Lachnospiraceae bacterium]
MMKKIRKMTLFVLLCAILLSGTVYAASRPGFNFSLTNSGQSYNKISDTYNKKTIKTDPWTLYINSITCSGTYGISFCPVRYNSSTNAIIKKCTSSSIWRHSTGGIQVGYASGDAYLSDYRLAARMDDSYHTTFKAAGWFNADKVTY